MPAALSPDLLEKMDAYWRATNYLTIGQIYLQDNPASPEYQGSEVICGICTMPPRQIPMHGLPFAYSAIRYPSRSPRSMAST
jgi:hypothetical protein